VHRIFSEPFNNVIEISESQLDDGDDSISERTYIKKELLLAPRMSKDSFNDEITQLSSFLGSQQRQENIIQTTVKQETEQPSLDLRSVIGKLKGKPLTASSLNSSSNDVIVIDDDLCEIGCVNRGPSFSQSSSSFCRSLVNLESAEPPSLSSLSQTSFSRNSNSSVAPAKKSSFGLGSTDSFAGGGFSLTQELKVAVPSTQLYKISQSQSVENKNIEKIPAGYDMKSIFGTFFQCCCFL
jgi:hypothetical protein